MAADETTQGALRRAFAVEARRGVQLAIAGRAVCFALLWLSFANNAHWNFENELLLYRSGVVALALVLGFASFLVAWRARDPVGWSYPFVLADFVVAAALVFGWQPGYLQDYPQFLAVRFQDVLFFVVVLAFSILPLSHRLPLAAAVAAGVAWYAGVLQAWFRTPGARTSLSAMSDTKPDVLNLDYLGLQLMGLLAFGLLLAGAVAGARRSVEATVSAMRDRDHLARFFPPAVLQALSAGQAALADRTTTVAVLFVDFDRKHGQAASLEELGTYFAACERVVFEHGGIIDRFAGDAVMASFGALEAEDKPVAPVALAAWRCARSLHRELSLLPLGCAGVGIALGPAMVGELGSARQHAFGVVGQTTNLASRLLEEARDRGLACVTTEEVAQHLSVETAPALQDLGLVEIRGFVDPLHLRAAAA